MSQMLYASRRAGSLRLPGNAVDREAAERRDLRAAPRKTLMIPGSVGIPGFRLAVPCRVIDMSATGAGAMLCVEPQDKLRVARDLPDCVVLHLPQDRIEVECEIQWRAGERFGARFLSPMRRRECEVL